MMSLVMPKIRKGDRISVEGVVRYAPGGLYVTLETEIGNDIMVKADEPSLRLVRAQIEVGDRVSFAEVGEERIVGSVLAVADDRAWVHLDNGEFATWWVRKIMRVDPEPDPIEPAPEQPPHVPTSEDAEAEIVF